MLSGNPAARVEALDPLAARTNYFVGGREQWHRDVPNFARVAYRSVYPGIDVVYYGNQDQLEYDFVLHPGADPRSIRLKFRGADRVRLTPEGDLSVEAAGAQFVQKRPVIYQEDPLTAERRPVEGRYELRAAGVVGLSLGGYDRSRPLVIDPVVTYSVFIGGASTDVITAVTTDSQGFIYIAGYTQNGDLVAYGNAVQAAYSAGKDAFVAKLDPNANGAATWVYFSYLGGARDDAATAIRVNAAGLIYVTGTTTSSDFPLAGTAAQGTLALSTTSTSAVFPTDAFVTIISVTDGLVYSTYFGGTGNETPNAIALNPSGLAYILGTTDSTDLPLTADAYQNLRWGPSDLFLAVIDPNTTAIAYSTYLGGEGREDGRGLALGPNGLVYFAATSSSTLFPLSGDPYRRALSGFENVVIGVMDLTQPAPNSLVYCTYFGGSSLDEVRGLFLDANGRLLVTGWTISPDFPVTANAMEPTLVGAANAFVTRLNPAAPPSSFVEYSTYLGGSVGEVAYDVKSDASGSIYVTGYTMSPDFPVTLDTAVQPTYGNGIDGFLVKFNPAVAGRPALQYGTYFGGIGTHV